MRAVDSELYTSLLSVLSSDSFNRLVHLETVDLREERAASKLQAPEIVKVIDPVVSGEHDKSVVVQDRNVVASSNGNLARYRLGFPFQRD